MVEGLLHTDTRADLGKPHEVAQTLDNALQVEEFSLIAMVVWVGREVVCNFAHQIDDADRYTFPEDVVVLNEAAILGETVVTTR